MAIFSAGTKLLEDVTCKSRAPAELEAVVLVMVTLPAPLGDTSSVLPDAIVVFPLSDMFPVPVPNVPVPDMPKFPDVWV
jgi:hypothetical protein